jgi:hypothetical protein
VPIASRRIDRPPIVAARARSVARARHSTRPREIPTQPSSLVRVPPKKARAENPDWLTTAAGRFSLFFAFRFFRARN